MKNQKIICIIAAVALMVTAVFCGYRIYSHYVQVDEQTEVFDELAAVVESTPTEETKADDTPVSEGDNVLAKYQELYLQNEDTELKNYPLFCPKCKQETLIEAKNLKVTVIKEPDAKTQSR